MKETPLPRATVSLSTLLLALLPLSLAGCGGSDSGSGSGSGGGSSSGGSSDSGSDDAAEDEDSGSGGSRPGGGRRGDKTPKAEVLGTEDVDSTEMGALYGEIRTTEKDREGFPIGARQKSECKHHPDVEHLSELILISGGKVQNAYVYIKSGYDDDAVPAAPTEPVTLDQKGCIYTPHVLGIRAGQKLLVANSDPTNHNVNVLARRNEGGNKNMGRGQAPVEYVFPRPEVGIRFKCDIHPWMGARVHVAEHPWYAITGKDGKFRIPDVPPGDYTIEVVHEQLGKTRGKVTVEAGKATGFALTLDG